MAANNRLVAALVLLSASALGQVADQLIVYGNSYASRYDRTLTQLGFTFMPSPGAGSLNQVCPIAIDAEGVSWICYAPLGATELVRLTADGLLLPSATLSFNPVHVTAASDGRTFALTRIPLLAPGPAYGLASDGAVQWSSTDGPSQYTLAYPDGLAMTANGELWIGEPSPPAGKFWAQTLLQRLDPDTGAVLDSYQPPDLTNGTSDELLAQFIGAPDGSLWMMRGGAGSSPGWFLERTDGNTILEYFQIVSAGSNGPTSALRVDGAGKLYVVSGNDMAGSQGILLYRFDPASPSTPEKIYTLGGIITGFALGANGDEVYAEVGPLLAPLTRRLERMNLDTGRKSSVSIGSFTAIPYGDPTGFIYANVIDRQGDNDGDGVLNGVETAARSNPYDAASRPEGPKVHIDFAAASNALILIYQDSDGLLNPAGGLDLSTLSVTIANYGNVFWLLAPFATALDLSTDGTQATLTFGGLPLPSNKKWEVEAHISDLTGASGWDWQVTPPGDL